jgi:hypothetical protein
MLYFKPFILAQLLESWGVTSSFTLEKKYRFGEW